MPHTSTTYRPKLIRATSLLEKTSNVTVEMNVAFAIKNVKKDTFVQTGDVAQAFARCSKLFVSILLIKYVCVAFKFSTVCLTNKFCEDAEFH